MYHSLNDPGLASPPSPYDDPTPCPECGAEDAEYGQHEPGCPSGYPTRDAEGEALQDAYREHEDEAGHVVAFSIEDAAKVRAKQLNAGRRRR